MLRMFQLAIRRAGVFVVFCFLPLTACREGPLCSTHPVEQASNVKVAPYRLGAAQLEAGSSCGKLPRHMLCRSLATPLECPLQFALSPGQEDKEMLGCPYDSVPFSVSLVGSKGKEEPIQLGASSTAEAAGRKC